MPPKKKAGSKKKKEVLPDPKTLPDGKCNYYIASWSKCQNIDGISEIARILLEQNTNADGEVGEIPRTNILIPAGTLGRGDAEYKVEVADNMYVESVPQSVIISAMLVSKTEDTEGGEEELRLESPTNDAESRYAGDTNLKPDGASARASEVCVRGEVDIAGVLTPIVVKPDLPEQPVLKLPKKGSKRKKSLILEEEQRFAEEMKVYEETVEKLVSKAKDNEAYLMQFAHPDRWPLVTFVNITFGGPVTIAHAHVKFQNCIFTSRIPQKAQLLVSQYCKVECEKCTFVQPIKCGIYCWPKGQVTVRNCFFTGTSIEGSGISARFECPNVVGLYADECKVHVEDCVFNELGTGILLCGGKESNASRRTKDETPTIVRRCRIERIFGVGILLDNVSGVEVARNKFSECEHYALDVVKGNSIRIIQNEFWSKLRVHDEAQAKILGNEIATVPLSPRDVDNPNWQPVY